MSLRWLGLWAAVLVISACTINVIVPAPTAVPTQPAAAPIPTSTPTAVPAPTPTTQPPSTAVPTSKAPAETPVTPTAMLISPTSTPDMSAVTELLRETTEKLWPGLRSVCDTNQTEGACLGWSPEVMVFSALSVKTGRAVAIAVTEMGADVHVETCEMSFEWLSPTGEKYNECYGEIKEPALVATSLVTVLEMKWPSLLAQLSEIWNLPAH